MEQPDLSTLCIEILTPGLFLDLNPLFQLFQRHHPDPNTSLLWILVLPVED